MVSSAFFGRKTKRVLAALTVAVFAAVMLFPARDARAITMSEEKEIGRKILEVVRRIMPLVEDGEVLTYVRSVGNRVAKQIGVTPYTFQFFVIDQPVPNAFAVPGGYIFIYRGIIEMMSSEGELASILAHELAHINAHHFQRQIDQSKVLSIGMVAGMLAGIFLGGGALGPALVAGSAAAGQTAALKYSRDHEMEADQMGFRFLCGAGYDPMDMAAMMHKMDQMKWTGSSRIPGYLQSHPYLGERVLYLEEMAKKQKSLSVKLAKPDTGDFQLMKATLIANYTDEGKALEKFKEGIKEGDKAAVYGLGRLYFREDRWADSEKQLREAARLMPSSPYVLSSLGAAYHREGKLQDARRTLESALMLDPSSAIAHYRLAMVLLDMGKKDDALDHLLKVEELSPMFPDIDYQLGVVFGQKNDLGLAHYHLGRYYLQKLDWPLAIMHLKKAKGYIKDSPAKIEEINLVLRDMEKKLKESPIKRR